ncbi:DUF6457 domain-containing protein [Micromonospora rifamycinica]|uniref:DUF6457 domain-containing protein n=1 Tax=Micromonospora rifamycinica TaxID=291594 RepID=UPI00342791AA
MTVLDDWVTAACAELDLDPAEVSVPTVLDLARDVAHQVLRPGAPVTAYLLGVAVGRGADPAAAAARLSGLAAQWPVELGGERPDRPADGPSDAGPEAPPAG